MMARTGAVMAKRTRASLGDMRKGKQAATMEQRADKQSEPAKVTVYIPKSAWRRLYALAAERPGKMNGILREALDAWLKKHGEPTLEEFEERERD